MTKTKCRCIECHLARVRVQAAAINMALCGIGCILAALALHMVFS